MERPYLTRWKQYLAEQDPRDVTRNEPGYIASPDQPNWPQQPDLETEYPSYDMNGNKIPWGDMKGFNKKAEVALSRKKQQSGDDNIEAYFFHMKPRRGDSTSGTSTTVAMYLPASGEWIDVDTNARIMKSKSGFTESEALNWLRKNGYLKLRNPMA